MANVVTGIGTAHSPLCSEEPKYWAEHGNSDLKNPELAELSALYAPPADNIAEELTIETFTAKFDRNHVAIDTTRQAIAAAEPDVLVVVGDDQDDLFLHTEMMPALAVYGGESFVNTPRDLEKYPEWFRGALWGYYPPDEPETYPGHPDLSRHLVSSFVGAGFDPALATVESENRHVGHAFTFINRRLVPAPYIPMVPLMLNTYFPPNQPSAARCYQLGLTLADALNNWDTDSRVVVVASGGLTHPLLDVELDLAVVRALEAGDREAMVGIGEELFRQGTTEIKNWITVAATMAAVNMNFTLLDYVPVHRSMASTGCGITFGSWS
jgi:3-O-methylgallate 3,4-dioxygenase